MSTATSVTTLDDGRVIAVATITAAYTSIHEATKASAGAHGVSPFAVRVLWAVAERGGRATSHEVQADLRVEGSAVRRAMAELYTAALLEGRGVDGGPRRRGIVTRLQITATGRDVVQHAKAHLDEDATPEAPEIRSEVQS